MQSGKSKKATEMIERCGVKMPMLDLNEIAVQKEIGSQPNTDEEEEDESDLDESLFDEGQSRISKDSKYEKIDTERRNKIFEQQKKSFKARMMGGEKKDEKSLEEIKVKEPQLKQLKLEGMEKKQDFNEEFMEKFEEFSESWRKAAQKQPLL